MKRKTIITKLLDFDHDDDIIVFPQNRTLYVDQFTDEAPQATKTEKVSNRGT